MSELSFSEVFKRLVIQHIFPYKYKIITAIFCMAIISLCSSFQVWLVKPALDKIFISKDEKTLNYLPLLIIMVSIIRGIATYSQNYIMKYIGQRVITDIQILLYKHLLYSDLSFLNQYSTGKIISKFTNDINILRNSIFNIITAVFRESLTIIFLIILMFYQSLTLALIGFIIFPLAILPILKMSKKMRKVSHRTQEDLANFVSQLDDSFQLIKVIKSYCKEEYERSRIAKIIENIFKLYIKAIRIESFSSPIMEALSGMAIGAIIWYGGKQVILESTSTGAFFSFIVAFIAAYRPLKSIASLNTNFQEGLIAARKIFAILDNKPLIIDPLDYKLLFNDVKGKIQFNNVQFKYPNGKIAINDLSMEIPAGKTVALVGGSGGGKSTLINLLLRFYDIDSGSIILDNHNIKEISIKDLRSNISLVSQEISLFNDTILSNICYSDPSASIKKIIRVARSALVHDFIKSLPDGYKTIVGQYGMRLSGGQKQRIALARALLKDSKILILDEATSALDNSSEEFIKNSINEYRGKKTIIIIAHRLSSVIDADIIFVFKDGKIIESGEHQELIQINGEYNKLYNREL